MKWRKVAILLLGWTYPSPGVKPVVVHGVGVRRQLPVGPVQVGLVAAVLAAAGRAGALRQRVPVVVAARDVAGGGGRVQILHGRELDVGDARLVEDGQVEPVALVAQTAHVEACLGTGPGPLVEARVSGRAESCGGEDGDELCEAHFEELCV